MIRALIAKPFPLVVLLLSILSLVACKQKTETGQKGSETPQKPHLRAYFARRPWNRGTYREARQMALAGQTIPLASYSFKASKDGVTYSGSLVGTSPFSTPLKGTTINVTIIPLKVTIGTAVFDPTASNPCDGNVSDVTRFAQSPLTNAVSHLTINDINVGDVQFINGFRRAEFWNTINGSSAYQNSLNFTYANAYEMNNQTIGSHGAVQFTGCNQLGTLNYDWLDGYLQSTVIPALTASNIISPKSAAMFLLHNVVQSEGGDPPNGQCCILGYHSAMGTPVQTYGTIDWDTSGNFENGYAEVAIASHEIGEWMDDPIASNATPAWGNIGQTSGCQGNWEVGDPLSGNSMPAITMNGKSYAVQELAFYSWFFNANTNPSVGTGGKYSSNGTFPGPAKPCPPGGTN
jgi:hypothetical protein